MRDFAFYNAGCDGPMGPTRSLIVFPRRLIRRLLRPIFQRQERINHELQDQVDALATKVDHLARELAAVAALGWDHVAIARRLASLEDEVSRLRRLESDRRVPSASKPHVALRETFK